MKCFWQTSFYEDPTCIDLFFISSFPVHTFIPTPLPSRSFCSHWLHRNFVTSQNSSACNQFWIAMAINDTKPYKQLTVKFTSFLIERKQYFWLWLSSLRILYLQLSSSQSAVTFCAFLSSPSKLVLRMTEHFLKLYLRFYTKLMCRNKRSLSTICAHRLTIN